MRVVDRFGTPGGHCHQLLGVGIGPGGLTAPVERVEEANMRRDERRSADDVAQPLAEFTQLRLFSTSMKTARNGVITAL